MPSESVTSKVQKTVFHYVKEFIYYKKSPPGVYSEQAVETVHQDLIHKVSKLYRIWK